MSSLELQCLDACVQEERWWRALMEALPPHIFSNNPPPCLTTPHTYCIPTIRVNRHGYLSTLPAEGECLPLTWGEGELRRLRGTSLEGRAEEDRAATQADYEEHVAGLAPKYPHIIPG